MSKHTPGPLTVVAKVSRIETINDIGNVVFSRVWPALSTKDKTVEDVLECVNFTGEYLVDRRETCSLANKRALADEVLRAAAPELLDILSRILGAHDSKNNGAYMGEATLCKHYADLARAAIAKAKGE